MTEYYYAVNNDSPSSAAAQWNDQEDGRLVLKNLEYLDVATLIKKKQVNKQWKALCTKTIDDKCGGKKKVFQSNDELRQAVNKYSPGIYGNNSVRCHPKHAEEVATTYGYPIDKWDVSNVKDFSYIFDIEYKNNFNEPIGSWDVSNATNMVGMFWDARSFNQDISTWDVSKVTNMKWMFNDAASFNQDISTWDVSNVTDMEYMFAHATSFNQNISSWNTASVTNMRYMFYYATSFNHDISSWNVTDGIRVEGMFYNCRFNARRLPWFVEDMILGEW